ncbi:MAG: drug/metabolite transporter (DMT)-like permease [Paracoccaceae bacterium]|jgi:drug/metabolite transporter (DMT)-like permease
MKPAQRPTNPTSGALFGLLAFGLFATHDVLLKILGGSHSVFQIAFMTSAFALPLVIGLHLFDQPGGSLQPKNPKWMAARVLVAMFVTPAIFYSFTVLKLTEVYAILFSTPLFVTALSVPVLKEKVGVYRWGAVFVGFLGVVWVIQPGVSPIGIGHATALFGAFGAAIAFVIVRKIGSQERKAVMIGYPLITNVISMGLLLPFVYKPVGVPELGLAVVMSVLGSTAMLSILAAYKRAEAVVVAPMQYSQILWALFFGWVFFAESLDSNVGVGSAIIVSSGIFILWRENRSYG